MKYESKRPSSKDKDIDCYLFSFGIEELKLFRAIASHYRQYIPRTIETIPVLGRLREFEKQTGNFLKNRKSDNN